MQPEELKLNSDKQGLEISPIPPFNPLKRKNCSVWWKFKPKRAQEDQLVCLFILDEETNLQKGEASSLNYSHWTKDERLSETRARGTRTIFDELNLSTVENTSSKNFKSVFTLPLGYFYLDIFHSNLILNVSETKHSPSNCLSSLGPDFSKRCPSVA